jgi:DMSO/TMAO reductase YedYZ molybdopterin-dependent catalytic subunit
MSDKTKLPPGQFELSQFPTFGLLQFAKLLPRETHRIELKIGGNVEEPVAVSDELRDLPGVEQTSDFHCVTTWSVRALRWSGFRFADFYERIVVPRARPRADSVFVILRGRDGYAANLPLSDLLADDVLFAERLNGEPLPLAHGAPLRLVAPAHYGFKSAKHVCAVEFWHDDRHMPAAPFRFMSHARGRVAFEERGTGVPGWLLRYLYRPLIPPGIWLFRRALRKHQREAPARATA